MNNNRYQKYKIIFFILLAGLGLVLLTVIVSGNNVAVFNSKGIIAAKERSLIITATLLMLIVVIPVLVMTFVFAWKYRASNPLSKYTPEWNQGLATELIGWAIPAVIILILAIITWKNTHALDPSKPIDSQTKPITIQVVALQWKWLFIYPEQNIATINFVQFPQSTPINFQLTADAPMNSFWIPQLGGQMYAMPGMSTHLHLEANESGEFNGSAAEISGRGFAGMKFIARASSPAEFDAWVQSVKQSPNILRSFEYNKLSKPSENNSVTYYSWTESNLYNSVIKKFMTPLGQTGGETMSPMQSMAH
jgi:cytochrome o ubiquinol oxidase subunit 2